MNTVVKYGACRQFAASRALPVRLCEPVAIALRLLYHATVCIVPLVTAVTRFLAVTTQPRCVVRAVRHRHNGVRHRQRASRASTGSRVCVERRSSAED